MRVAVDVIVRMFDQKILLIKRKNEPYKGYWALPGGFVEENERVEDAAVREVKEETGIDIVLQGIVGVYSEPGRDSRGHVISICYSAYADNRLKPVADTDAAEIGVFEYDKIPLKLAFDHRKMLEDAGIFIK